MTKTLTFIFAFVLIAAVAAFGQEHIDTREIGPGKYREIQSFRLSGESTLEMTAGGSRKFEVLSTVSGLAGSYRRVIAPASWSVSPPVAGVSIDNSGLLTIAAGVPTRSTFSVKAEVTIKESWEPAGYQATVEQPVLVFDPKIEPLAGRWYQVRTRPCKGAPETYGEERGGVGELRFRADGTYSVTAKPFEVYKDYWGRYRTDGRSIELTADGGNGIPLGLDLSGSFRFSGKDVLELDDLSLWPGLYSSQICGMTFVRYGSEAQPDPVAWLHEWMDTCCVEEYVWRMLDEYIRVLNIEVSATGHIVIAPRTAAAGKRFQAMIRKRLRVVKFDASRIVIDIRKSVGSNSLGAWVVPAGAKFP